MANAVNFSHSLSLSSCVRGLSPIAIVTRVTFIHPKIPLLPRASCAFYSGDSCSSAVSRQMSRHFFVTKAATKLQSTFPRPTYLAHFSREDFTLRKPRWTRALFCSMILAGARYLKMTSSAVSVRPIIFQNGPRWDFISRCSCGA